MNGTIWLVLLAVLLILVFTGLVLLVTALLRSTGSRKSGTFKNRV